MLYSFSTVLMAVLTSNLLLALVVLCFFNSKLMINAGHKLLLIFVLFTILRFLFPFELPQAIRLPIPETISNPLGIFQKHGLLIYKEYFSFWNFIEIIWLIGAIIGLLYHIILRFRTYHYIVLHQKILTQQEPYFSMLEKICKERNKSNHFQVIELPGIDVPMLYGIFRPCILIPENFHVSETELYCYLSHEASHHFHHDLLLKTIVKLITIVYWWNPFSSILNNQTDMALEMRVDNALTKSNSEDTAVYTRCLLDMAERVIDHTKVPKILSMSFLSKSGKRKKDNITKRVQLLLSNQQKKNPLINTILFFSVIAIYMLSYIIILEGYYIPKNLTGTRKYDLIISEASFAIQNEDGTYDIYFYSVKCETVSSLTYYPDNMPVYTYDNLPEDIRVYLESNSLKTKPPSSSLSPETSP